MDKKFFFKKSGNPHIDLIIMFSSVDDIKTEKLYYTADSVCWEFLHEGKKYKLEMKDKK